MLTDVLVPGNRWDLLGGYPAPTPEVSVVVTHYEQHDDLARTVAALHRQTLRPLEVVVADDGSKTCPVPPAGPVPVRVVRQEDRGFRAAAARNLGARHCGGEVLVFLDADTVPEPDFVRSLVGHVARCPDVLAVGRRRHADLSAAAPGDDPRSAPRLPEPDWLRAGYAESRDLLDADGRGFRFVISAVLACRRALFADLGGFDERFVGYGGEDWDLGYRAWNAGAVLVHEAAAVAWHNGPDWAGRDDPRTLDRQTASLAALVPEPGTRGVALPAAVPDVLVEVDPAEDFADTVRVVHSLLRQSHRDLGVRLSTPDPAAVALYGSALRCEPWSADQLRRARARFRVRAPLPPAAVRTAMAELGTAGEVVLRSDGIEVGTALSTRAAGRARRWAGRFDGEFVLASAFGARTVDVGSAPPARDTLAGFLAAPWDPPPGSGGITIDPYGR